MSSVTKEPRGPSGRVRRTAGLHEKAVSARAALVARLWRAAHVQVRAHETRLKGLEPADAGTEAQAKALATLARTVRDLIELDMAARRAAQSMDAEGTADGEMQATSEGAPDRDSALTDLGSLRAELARRLEGLVARRAD